MARLTQSEFMSKLKTFIGDRIVIAHNAASFDVNFIQVVGERIGLTFEYEVIDTLPLAQNLLTELKKHRVSLEDLNLNEISTIGIFSHMHFLRCFIYTVTGSENKSPF